MYSRMLNMLRWKHTHLWLVTEDFDVESGAVSPNKVKLKLLEYLELDRLVGTLVLALACSQQRTCCG